MYFIFVDNTISTIFVKKIVFYKATNLHIFFKCFKLKIVK